jgi:hypothetical protein
VKMAISDQDRAECSLMRQGKFSALVRIEEARWHDRLTEPGVGSLLAGRRADGERVAAIVPRPQAKASIFAALADKDRTLDALDQMAPLGPIRVGWTLMSPRFAFLRVIRGCRPCAGRLDCKNNRVRRSASR